MTRADQEAIRELVQRAADAQADSEVLPTLHTEDAVIVNIAGRRVLGRPAFADAMATAMASPLADVRTSVEVIDIRLAAPDVAIVSCTKTVQTDDPPSRGALTYVMVRTPEGWRIALAQNDANRLSKRSPFGHASPL